MSGTWRRVFKLNAAVAILTFIYSAIAHAQGVPLTGTALIDAGPVVSGQYGSTVQVPINVDLSGVAAVDVNSATVAAVLGSYRIAISYDNTLLKAKTLGVVVAGGATPEFSAPAYANIITSGTTDTLIIMQSQLSDISPAGYANVARLVFDVVSLMPVTTSLVVTVLDLRTPLILTGNSQQPIIGGVEIPTQVMNGSVDILASTDTDGDGMPDAWEIANGFDPGDINDGVLDWDSDGLSNLNEYLNSTDPQDPDSDNDLVPDGAEVVAGNDPDDPADFPLWIISSPVTVALEMRAYQYTVVTNNTGIAYSLDTAPPGMNIDAATGVIDWIPGLGETGNFTITVRADKDSFTAIQDYALTVMEIGDVNADGLVNAADYLLVQRHILEISYLTAQQVESGDLYPPGAGDGQVTLSDLILLMKKIVGQ